MIIDKKLDEYRGNIESLQVIDSLEVYRWLISLGEKLQEDPLSKIKCTSKNKVDRCQFDLFVDMENNKFNNCYIYVFFNFLRFFKYNQFF